MRWIYLSPHLDDVALSVGGLIREQVKAGIPVEIWTMMAGFPPEGEVSPLAGRLHHLWGFSSAHETLTERRKEDQKAASILGARPVHFDFLDCIYRRGPDGAWLYPEDVAISPRPEDGELPAMMAESVSMRLLPDDVVVCQFALGRHVDHVIVRAAAELLGRPLWYAVDIPYLFDHPGDLGSNTTGMSNMVHPVSRDGFRAWERAVLAYKSQLSSLLDSLEGLRTALREYWADKGGISLWRPNG